MAYGLQVSGFQVAIIRSTLEPFLGDLYHGQPPFGDRPTNLTFDGLLTWDSLRGHFTVAFGMASQRSCHDTLYQEDCSYTLWIYLS